MQVDLFYNGHKHIYYKTCPVRFGICATERNPDGSIAGTVYVTGGNAGARRSLHLFGGYKSPQIELPLFAFCLLPSPRPLIMILFMWLAAIESPSPHVALCRLTLRTQRCCTYAAWRITSHPDDFARALRPILPGRWHFSKGANVSVSTLTKIAEAGPIAGHWAAQSVAPCICMQTQNPTSGFCCTLPLLFQAICICQTIHPTPWRHSFLSGHSGFMISPFSCPLLQRL
jgi:hypothetical protein